MASLLIGEPSHHGAPEENLKVSQEQHEGGGGRWYLSKKEIEENSPSRRDGISLKKETSLRRSYSTFLQKLGKELKVPQVTIATAIVFCHRFFLRQSHAKNDRMIIAIACMFLAGKVEETPRFLKDVVLVSYKIIYQNDAADVQRIRQKEVYEQKKELILLGERAVLVTLGFDLNICHPYGPLVRALKKLKVAQSSLAQVAWNFVNDGLRTSLCLQFQPRQIAAGALFLAALCLEVKLPSDGENAWWEEYGVTQRQLEDIRAEKDYSSQMLDLYDHKMPPFQDSGAVGNAGGSQPTPEAPANEEYITSYNSSCGGAALKASSLKPAPLRPGPDEHHTDRWGEDGTNDLQHHEREAIPRQGILGETQNTREFGIEGHCEYHQEGNRVRIEPRDAEELKDKYHDRNLSKDVTVGHQPQHATIELDREKLKAAFARRKARGDIIRKVDPMDELERELEDVQVLGDSEKTKGKRKQSWSKPSRPEHEASLHGDDFGTVEEGEVLEPSVEVDHGYSSRAHLERDSTCWRNHV